MPSVIGIYTQLVLGASFAGYEMALKNTEVLTPRLMPHILGGMYHNGQ